MEVKRSFDLIGKDFPANDAGYMRLQLLRVGTVACENVCRVLGARPRRMM